MRRGEDEEDMMIRILRRRRQTEERGEEERGKVYERMTRKCKEDKQEMGR